MAAGPLMAEAKPIRMGGAWAPAASAMSSRVASVIASRMTVSLADDGEVLARAGEGAGAAGRDLDGVLDLHAAPAVLVVRCLHAEDHAGLQRGVGRGVDRRRIVGLEPDSVSHVMTLVVGH